MEAIPPGALPACRWLRRQCAVWTLKGTVALERHRFTGPGTTSCRRRTGAVPGGKTMSREEGPETLWGLWDHLQLQLRIDSKIIRLYCVYGHAFPTPARPRRLRRTLLVPNLMLFMQQGFSIGTENASFECMRTILGAVVKMECEMPTSFKRCYPTRKGGEISATDFAVLIGVSRPTLQHCI